MSTITQQATQMPIACALASDEQATRQVEVEALFTAVLAARELDDGYAFAFPGDAAQAAQLLNFIVFERACCPFFNFELAFEPGQGPIWLSLRGAAGVKEVVAGIFRATLLRLGDASAG
jgi:hypothetical protein